MIQYIFPLLVIAFLFAPSFAFAQTPTAAPTCTMVYGGGETQCQTAISANTTVTATPTPSATSSASNAGPTTKGGLPVYSPTPTNQTPPTGPEALGLLGLIPAAAAGFYLRNKTK